MDGSLPNGFIDFSTAHAKKDSSLYNVMGVVTDYMPPTSTRGPDWQCTFSLDDSTVPGIGQKVKFFKPQKDMPPVKGPGDIVILRDVKTMKHFSTNAPIIISGKSTTWTIFHSGTIPEHAPPYGASIKSIKTKDAPNPTAQELAYVVELNSRRDPGKFSMPLTQEAIQNMTKPREKFSLIKDVCANIFYDLVGLVVKVYSSGDRVELYVTDYTSNCLLCDYIPGIDDEEMGVDSGTSRKWRGPSGKHTLQITLFPPHALWAYKHVREGHYVFLRNVRVKLNRDSSSVLEGVLHGDRKNESRIDVSTVDPTGDDRAKEVLRRKRDYERNEKRNRPEPSQNSTSQDPSGSTKPPTEKTGKSKSQRKRERERRKKQQAKANDQPNCNPHADSESDQPLKKRKLSPLPTETSRVALRAAIHTPNPHIRTTFPDHPIRSLKDILAIADSETSTTLNPKPPPSDILNHTLISRATVRVLDFWPHSLEDFARRRKIGEYDILSDCGSGDEGEGEEDDEDDEEEEDGEEDGNEPVPGRKKYVWEWKFILRVEDASPAAPLSADGKKVQIILFSTLENADYLLKMEAQK